MTRETYSLSVLRRLEAESVHILREVVAEFERPVLMYSVGKDSSVLLRLAQKAFHPGRIPFPLLHVDTDYKFPEMYEFRDRTCAALGVELRVFRNESAIAANTNPWDLGTVKCCGLLKTQGLLDALKAGNYDAVIGGARREEAGDAQRAGADGGDLLLDPAVGLCAVGADPGGEGGASPLDRGGHRGLEGDCCDSHWSGSRPTGGASPVDESRASATPHPTSRQGILWEVGWGSGPVRDHIKDTLIASSPAACHTSGSRR